MVPMLFFIAVVKIPRLFIDDGFYIYRPFLDVFFAQRFLNAVSVFDHFDLQTVFVDEAAYQVVIRAVITGEPRLLPVFRRRKAELQHSAVLVVFFPSDDRIFRFYFA